MQTPKTRKTSSEVPRKVSPRPSSLEVPQKISPRADSSEVSKKVSPRVVRRLKTTTQDSDSTSSWNRASKTPTEKSPKVTERRTPRTPTSEKKPPSRVADLDSQISHLQSDLNKVQNELNSSEAFRQQAQQDAEESKKQLLALSEQLEESRKQLLKQSVPEAPLAEPLKVSNEQDQKLLSVIESSVESAALASAVNEIKELKVHLEMVAESEATQTKHAEIAQTELRTLKQNLAETLVIMEEVKEQLRDCKESEAHAQALVAETLMQLATAKRTVEALRSDGSKSMEAYDAIVSELEQSRERVNILEELVSKLKAGGSYSLTKDSPTSRSESLESERNRNSCTEAELHALKYKAEQLKSALEAAEIRYNEELHHNAIEIRNAHELVEKMKSTLSQRETEVEMDSKRLNVHIEELKANLMDKETELQGICEENEVLNTRLKSFSSGKREYDLEKELEKSKADIEKLKTSLIAKESELQIISEENEKLKLDVKRKETDSGEMNDEITAVVEAARAAEREALMKVGYMTEEVEKINRKAARVSEQLEAAEATNSDLEAELRRLKVQADQWRKAAEAAAAMLSSGNNGKFMERTGSMDSHYSPNLGKINLSYDEDMEDDTMKKKNANMLKKIGVLWKKQQK